jgi:hypothetical protein
MFRKRYTTTKLRLLAAVIDISAKMFVKTNIQNPKDSKASKSTLLCSQAAAHAPRLASSLRLLCY